MGIWMVDNVLQMQLVESTEIGLGIIKAKK